MTTAAPPDATSTARAASGSASGREAPATAPPLRTATKLWYGTGQLAEGLKNEAFSLFLLFYYTAVLGVPGTYAGQAILVALVFDAVTDPLAGVLSDRLRSRWGRRHPFLYAAALPLGLCFYATFAPPAGLTPGELALWLAVFAVGTRLSMTLFHVPHLSLGAELSSDYQERTQIVTLQFFFARIGQGLAGLLGLAVFMRPSASHPDGRFDPAAYPALALTLSVMMVVCVLASAWKTHDRIPFLTPPDPESRRRTILGAVVGDLAGSLRNDSFRWLFSGLVLTYVSWGIGTALGLHLATYFWHVSADALVGWGVASGVGVFGGLGVWPRVAARWDKKPVFMTGIAIFTTFVSIPPFLKLLGAWPAEASALYLPAFVLTTGLVAHFGLAAPMVTGRSMMADVTDEDVLRFGRRREGIFFGAASLSAKLAFGVGSLVSGLIVDAVGLVPGARPDEVGTAVATGLGLTAGLSTLLLCGLSIAVFSRYRLDRARHAEIRAALDARAADALDA